MQQKKLDDFVHSGSECPTCGRTDFASQQGMFRHHAIQHDESLATETLLCENCGSEYQRRSDRAQESQYCSTECKNEGQHGENHPNWKGMTVDCAHCGNDVRTTTGRLERYENMFCNSECQYAYQTGENHPLANRETRPCTNCGIEITRCVAHFGEQSFCNRDCYSEWLSEQYGGPDDPRWNRKQVECENCGVEIWRKQHQLDDRTHVCSDECRWEWMSTIWGPEHHRWKGGHRKVDILRRCLGAGSWQSYQHRAREAAGNVCEMCGDKPLQDELDVHHIVPLNAGGTNADDLLMTLCKGCHSTTERYIESIPEIEPVLIE